MLTRQLMMPPACRDSIPLVTTTRYARAMFRCFSPLYATEVWRYATYADVFQPPALALLPVFAC